MTSRHALRVMRLSGGGDPHAARRSRSPPFRASGGDSPWRKRVGLASRGRGGGAWRRRSPCHDLRPDTDAVDGGRSRVTCPGLPSSPPQVSISFSRIFHKIRPFMKAYINVSLQRMCSSAFASARVCTSTRMETLV